MILFTDHAVDRYLDFHAIDRPTMTHDEARELLEQHADSAIKLPAKTRVRGDDQWAIEALGIELVARHGSLRGVVGDVCVTILPPPRLRGLSPLQAERVELMLAAAGHRRVELQAERVALAAVTAVPLPRDRAQRAVARAPHDLASARLLEIRAELALVTAEHLLLVPILKTMRHQITSDVQQKTATAALRLALQYLNAISISDPHASLVLAQIREIDPGFLTNQFLNQ